MLSAHKRPSLAVTLAGAALAAALAAVVLSLTGIATGLPGRNNIDNNDLKKRVVKAINIQRNAVRAWQVAPNGVANWHVRDLRWTAIPFENGWGPFTGAGAGPPGYAKDAQGMVHLRGSAMQPSSAGGTIFTLPPGYRPASVTGISTNCLTLGSSISATLLVTADGKVSSAAAGGGNQNICEDLGGTIFDGVSFYPGG